MAIDLKGLIDAVATQVTASAADEHEASVLLFAATQLLQQKWQAAQQTAEEARAALVLEKRAVESGRSVAEQKADAAELLNKAPSKVTAQDVLNVVIARPELAPVEPRLEDRAPVAPPPPIKTLEAGADPEP